MTKIVEGNTRTPLLRKLLLGSTRIPKPGLPLPRPGETVMKTFYADGRPPEMRVMKTRGRDGA